LSYPCPIMRTLQVTTRFFCVIHYLPRSTVATLKRSLLNRVDAHLSAECLLQSLLPYAERLKRPANSLLICIHRSAWKWNSQKFALTEFSDVHIAPVLLLRLPWPRLAAFEDYLTFPGFLINTHRTRPTVWRLLGIGPGLWAVCVNSDPLHIGGPSRSPPISMMPSTRASCELPRTHTWRSSQNMSSRHLGE
jgi:hypothetical protein